MAEVEKSLRYRVNVTRGMSGAFSFEATVDGLGYTMDEVLNRSDEVMEALEKRYPFQAPRPKS